MTDLKTVDELEGVCGLILIVTRRFVWLGLLSDEATTTDLVVVVIVVDEVPRAPLRLKARDAAVRASCSPLAVFTTLTWIADDGVGGAVAGEGEGVIDVEEYLLLWWV